MARVRLQATTKYLKGFSSDSCMSGAEMIQNLNEKRYSENENGVQEGQSPAPRLKALPRAVM